MKSARDMTGYKVKVNLLAALTKLELGNPSLIPNCKKKHFTWKLNYISHKNALCLGNGTYWRILQAGNKGSGELCYS